MHDVESQSPKKYEHQLVTVESGDCKCNKHHDKKEALWGGVLHPDDVPLDIRQNIEQLHSVEVEYRKV